MRPSACFERVVERALQVGARDREVRAELVAARPRRRRAAPDAARVPCSCTTPKFRSGLPSTTHSAPSPEPARCMISPRAAAPTMKRSVVWTLRPREKNDSSLGHWLSPLAKTLATSRRGSACVSSHSRPSTRHARARGSAESSSRRGPSASRAVLLRRVSYTLQTWAMSPKCSTVRATSNSKKLVYAPSSSMFRVIARKLAGIHVVGALGGDAGDAACCENSCCRARPVGLVALLERDHGVEAPQQLSDCGLVEDW